MRCLGVPRPSCFHRRKASDYWHEMESFSSVTLEYCYYVVDWFPTSGKGSRDGFQSILFVFCTVVRRQIPFGPKANENPYYVTTSPWILASNMTKVVGSQREFSFDFASRVEGT